MKLFKRISVAGQACDLVSDSASLAMNTPGRASFVVQSEKPLAGIVIYSVGYSVEKVAPWFIGYVETSTTLDKKQQRIFCRELSASLFYRLPMALRNADLIAVLHAVSLKTGLEFVTPDPAPAYASNTVPVFYNLANGYHAMDCLADLFGIAKPLWQQRADGKIYVGSWDDSHWAGKPVTVPRDYETELTGANSATLPAIPALRPGVLYNDAILTAVEFSGAAMKLTWSENPWEQT